MRSPGGFPQRLLCLAKSSPQPDCDAEATDKGKEFYNFQRTDQEIDGLVPADRYFGAGSEVPKTLKKRVAANALERCRSHSVRMAPRRPATGEDLGIPLTGIVDLVINDRDGPRICDFKTAARSASPHETLHEIQLSSYSYLFRRATGDKEGCLEIRSLIKTCTPIEIAIDVATGLRYSLPSLRLYPARGLSERTTEHDQAMDKGIVPPRGATGKPSSSGEDATWERTQSRQERRAAKTTGRDRCRRQGDADPAQAEIPGVVESGNRSSVI